MQILKIEENEGKYSIDGKNYLKIEDIDKEAILEIMKQILKEEDIQLDEISDTKKILNPAQAIIYRDLYLKLKTLIDEKPNIMQINEQLFSDFKEE
jgi:hypothetical protein